MLKISVVQVFVLLVFVDIAISLIPNGTIADVGNHLKAVKTRRQEGKRKKDKSTSSSKDRGGSSKDNSDNSLGLSTEGITSSQDSAEKKKKENKYRPKSSEDRTGWRKWHRKCTPCIEDQVKKWRDPSIKWICGAFQRARRSFKSLCMMHYRNCQDGTMFTKVNDHRCADDNTNTHGEHFFYEYKVFLSDESGSNSEEEEPTSKDDAKSSSA